MKIEPTNDVWAVQTLRLVQAMLGAVSPNFRMVAIAHDGHRWKLMFVLEEDRVEDRQEIEDIAVEFEALQEKPIAYEVTVSVVTRQIEWPPQSVRVVYRRREVEYR